MPSKFLQHNFFPFLHHGVPSALNVQSSLQYLYLISTHSVDPRGVATFSEKSPLISQTCVTHLSVGPGKLHIYPTLALVILIVIQ